MFQDGPRWGNFFLNFLDNWTEKNTLWKLRKLKTILHCVNFNSMFHGAFSGSKVNLNGSLELATKPLVIAINLKLKRNERVFYSMEILRQSNKFWLKQNDKFQIDVRF